MEPFKSIQDILNYAIAREAEAHSFYKDLSHHVEKSDLQKTLQNFALDEFQHKIHLEAVRDGEVAMHPDEVGSLDIADSLIDIQPHDNMDYSEVLAVAIRKENAAFNLYSKLAEAARDPKTRKIFLLLAQEEAKHKLALEIEYDLTTF
jgi:rubrerythrin